NRSRRSVRAVGTASRQPSTVDTSTADPAGRYARSVGPANTEGRPASSAVSPPQRTVQEPASGSSTASSAGRANPTGSPAASSATRSPAYPQPADSGVTTSDHGLSTVDWSTVDATSGVGAVIAGHRTRATAASTAAATSSSGGYSRARPTTRPRTDGSCSAA